MHWSAPEILKGDSYGLKADIYSFGCFAYELATGKPPFAEETDILSVLDKHLARIPDKWSDQFASFVALCLEKDPLKRPTIESLLQHSFLQDAESHR